VKIRFKILQLLRRHDIYKKKINLFQTQTKAKITTIPLNIKNPSSAPNVTGSFCCDKKGYFHSAQRTIYHRKSIECFFNPHYPPVRHRQTIEARWKFLLSLQQLFAKIITAEWQKISEI
jgi:hypothetical protein